jgi:alcohol dehydrogenase class IV
MPIIYFGNGKISDLTAIAERFGKSVLLVTGDRSFIDTPQAALLFERIRKLKFNYQHLTVRTEPSPELVNEAVARFGKEKIDVVISIGGGSVIDAGKAISAMMYKKESVAEYLEVVGTREHPGTKVPFIAIPTTSGTGSEATKNAVISKVGKGGYKRSLRHDDLVPDIALVDPGLTAGCPPDITAAAGMDCFTQLTEAYLSAGSNEFTDALATEGFKAVKRSLCTCYINGEDINARADMSFAALMSGICLANAGLGAVHGIAGVVGGLFGIPHGLICGTLMAAVNKVNVMELRKTNPDHPALKKYASLGKIFSELEGKNDDFYTDSFIDILQKMTDDLNLPGLGSYGLKQGDVSLVVAEADSKNNPVKLSEELMAQIIRERL